MRYKWITCLGGAIALCQAALIPVVSAAPVFTGAMEKMTYVELESPERAPYAEQSRLGLGPIGRNAG